MKFLEGTVVRSLTKLTEKKADNDYRNSLPLTILFSPCAPLLNVVARVEEQLSEYQGDSP